MSDFESWVGEEITQLRHGSQLKHPTPYQSLFRYVGLGTKTSWDLFERMLQRSELIGATAHSLNDPFELSPVRFDDLSATTMPRPPNIRELLDDNAQPPSAEDEEARIEGLRAQAISYLDGKIKNARIIAFYQQSQSGLLWSHYANSYKGACLHFMARGFSKLRGNLGLVSYSRFRPIYPLSLAASLTRPSTVNRTPIEIDNVKRSESDKMLFFTKSEDWAYESEARLVFDARRETSIRFSPGALASIILGPHISSEDADRVQRLVELSPYPKIPLRRARLSSTTFSVEMDEGAVDLSY